MASEKMVELRNWKWVVVLIMAMGSLKIHAHPTLNTVVELSVREKVMKGVAKIPESELETALKQPVDEIDTDSLEQYFKSHIVSESGSGEWETTINSIEFTKNSNADAGSNNKVVVHFEMKPVWVGDLRHFTFDYAAIIQEVVTHKIMVFLAYDWGKGLIEESQERFIGYISVDSSSGEVRPLEVDLGEENWYAGTKSMFLFGMEHTRKGLDHILFLLALLLITPLAILNWHWSEFQGTMYTLTRFLKISLSFTLGYSLALLIGAFGWFRFANEYVDVLIALSILVVAVHCIKPLFYRKESLIACAFGLIHGLAFSNSLNIVGLDFNARLLSVLGFNLGVEAMQLIIMVCFFPVLLLSKWTFYRWVRVGFAAMTIFISIAWLMEPITEQENVISVFVNALLG